MQFDLTPAQRALQAKASALARGPIAARAAEIDRSEEYPWDNIALLKEAGFLGMTIPPGYGGIGASYLDAVLVIEEMANGAALPAVSSLRPTWARLAPS
jgi:alkylation response protein AidB-like acyl-CoA dehydrogenase